MQLLRTVLQTAGHRAIECHCLGAEEAGLTWCCVRLAGKTAGAAAGQGALPAQPPRGSRALSCPRAGSSSCWSQRTGSTWAEESRGWWCCWGAFSLTPPVPAARSGQPAAMHAHGLAKEQSVCRMGPELQTVLQPHCFPVTSRRNCELRACRLLCSGT